MSEESSDDTGHVHQEDRDAKAKPSVVQPRDKILCTKILGSFFIVSEPALRESYL